MSLNKGIQGFKARIMGARTASATPDSLGYEDGCPSDNKIHGRWLYALGRLPRDNGALIRGKSILQNLVSKSFIPRGAGYNRGESPESRCLTGTFRRIASYSLVEAVAGSYCEPEHSFSNNQRLGGASKRIERDWSGGFVPARAGEKHGDGRSHQYFRAGSVGPP